MERTIKLEKEATKNLLRNFLRRLTNLSGRNRSLFLPRLYAEQFIDVHSFTFLKNRSSFSIIENLIAGKGSLLCAEVDSRMEANNVASRKLKVLQRTDKFLFDERGSRDLYVGWPFVHGKFLDGTLVRCPLLYFPAELKLEEGQWSLHLRSDVDLTFNKSFLLAYSFYNRVQPNEALLEEDFADFDKDSTVFRSSVYQMLQKNNLEVNFNPDNFRDELIAFKDYKKEEFETLYGDGQLKLIPEAVLGVFPQAGSTLVPDYLDLIENEKIHDLEDFFYQRTNRVKDPDGLFLQDVREEKVYSIFPLDVWQENALKGVKLGHSLVVQGPPGTGKSQLICNLISDFIANEKRVLVVCQKRVAIDVVYNRLKEKRIDDFIGLVHDFRDDRKALFEKASKQIERIEEYKTRNNSLNSIQLERTFFEVSRKIDALCEELENFKKFLFDDTDCGKSVKEMYVNSDISQPSIELKQDLSHLKWNEVDLFRKKLRSYARLAQKFMQENYPWRVRRSFSDYTINDLKSIRNALSQIRPWFEGLQADMQKLTGKTIGWEEFELYVEKDNLIGEVIEALAHEKVYENFQYIVHEPEEETNSLWLANMEKMMLDCFETEGPELSVATADLGKFQGALDRSMRSRRGLLGLVRWQLFSKDKMLITRILLANHLKSSGDGFRMLEKMLDRRLNLEHNLTKLRSKNWIKGLPACQTADDLTEWFSYQQNAALAKSNLLVLRGLKSVLDPLQFTRQEYIAKLNKIRELVKSFPVDRDRWKQWLLPGQIRQVAEMPSWGKELEKSILEDFDALCDFDRLSESMLPYEKQIIGKLFDLHNQWEEASFETTFVNSLCLAWIDHIELKHPELRIVSNGKVEQMEEELQALIGEKEAIGAEILLMRARERMVDNLEFNRLNNRVTYRDLGHQLAKKKKIWPIRKVIGEFEDEIFRLLPCWMASPEAVSSIFPMKDLFDVVIFDEASQCFAERGIPALYRGKQVVIAGDHQQLQPSDLYMTRWEDEENEGDPDPDLEALSLLDLGRRYLQEVALNGHYRSQLPELIQFSNQHFYKGKLRVLPDRYKINEKQPAIQYLKTDGRWKDNVNREEAERIAELIRVLSAEQPGKDIGVITFNAPQQALILDLLDEAAVTFNWKIPETLFVKNIENVQGDERDIIIFSIGYAKDQKGKLSIKFGSLNLAGGENRLNVAVTRAKEKIIIVTSIEPEDLKVDDVKNRGPKLLKDYLVYAKESAQRKGPASVYEVDRRPASWYLKRVIKNEIHYSFSLESNVPFCDFMVGHNETYSALLLTDDDHYFENPSAKSAHGLIPRALLQKHWKYRMLYSRNHWLNPEKFWNEIKKMV
ncbi:MAG TPA: AAA domain-containing protein [Cyclobacteriaceae bacterium]|nr:AAA domain-containing protein [Cyclobacteriaceae bacterium]